MDPKQDMPVTARSSRPLTPATPARSSVRQAYAPQTSVRKAWVVADWKHRVPDPGLSGPRPAAGSLHSTQRVSRGSFLLGWLNGYAIQMTAVRICRPKQLSSARRTLLQVSILACHAQCASYSTPTVPAEAALLTGVLYVAHYQHPYKCSRNLNITASYARQFCCLLGTAAPYS